MRLVADPTVPGPWGLEGMLWLDVLTLFVMASFARPGPTNRVTLQGGCGQISLEAQLSSLVEVVFQACCPR